MSRRRVDLLAVARLERLEAELPVVVELTPAWMTGAIVGRVFEFTGRLMAAQRVSALEELVPDERTDRLEWWWPQFAEMDEAGILEVFDSLVAGLPASTMAEPDFTPPEVGAEVDPHRADLVEVPLLAPAPGSH
jgi:hypothetical protein